MEIRKTLGMAAACAAALGLATTGPAKAQPVKANRSKPSGLPTLARWELPNGLRVAYVGLHRAPVVAVQLWYRVGSKDEPRDRRGIASFFRDLMQTGSTHVRPGGHAELISAAGGYTDATTVEDASAFANSVPKQYLGLALKLEAERMRNLEWQKQAVDAARRRKATELKRIAADPLKQAVLSLMEVAYQRHPYAWEATGHPDDVDNITLSDLKKLYETYYVPNNALVVIVGDVTENEARKAVETHFGGLEKAAAPPRPASKAVEPPQTKERRKVLDGAQIGVVLQGYHIPEARHADIYALQTLSLLLGVGQSSRLWRSLVATGLSAKAGTSAVVREHPGMLVSFAAYANPKGAGVVEKVMRAEVTKLQKTAPKKAEVDKARNLILTDFYFRMERSTDLANQVGMSWVLTGDPEQFLRDVKAFEKLVPADIQRVANKYLTKQNLTTVIIPPKAR